MGSQTVEVCVDEGPDLVRVLGGRQIAGALRRLLVDDGDTDGVTAGCIHHRADGIANGLSGAAEAGVSDRVVENQDQGDTRLGGVTNRLARVGSRLVERSVGLGGLVDDHLGDIAACHRGEVAQLPNLQRGDVAPHGWTCADNLCILRRRERCAEEAHQRRHECKTAEALRKLPRRRSERRFSCPMSCCMMCESFSGGR